MYYVTLRKIESIHNNITSSEINGLATELPAVGKAFFMYSHNSVTKDIQRYIHTTNVVSVANNLTENEILFKTRNSTYILINIQKASFELDDQIIK